MRYLVLRTLKTLAAGGVLLGFVVFSIAVLADDAALANVGLLSAIVAAVVAFVTVHLDPGA